MGVRFEKIDNDNLRVIQETEGIVSRQRLETQLIALRKEKAAIQTDIDKILSQLAVLDQTR